MYKIAAHSELKQSALEQLNGHWGKGAITTLILIVIYFAMEQVPYVGSWVGLIFDGPIMLGMTYFYVRIMKAEPVNIADMFSGFNRFLFALGLQLLSLLFVLLWMLLLIIPGIVASISYAMAYYIALDQPHLTAMEALRESKRMMKGHRWRYFTFQLSFIGWLLLSILTLGIGMLWLVPYISTANANFYANLKASSEA